MNELFQRKELKYVLSEDQRNQLLKEEGLVPDIYPDYRLESSYLDTKDFDLLSTCVRKSPYREKVRVRTYSDSGSFLEVKRDDAVGVVDQLEGDDFKEADGISGAYEADPGGVQQDAGGESQQYGQEVEDGVRKHVEQDVCLGVVGDDVECHEQGRTALTMPALERAGITGWKTPATKSMIVLTMPFFSSGSSAVAVLAWRPARSSISSNTSAT